MSKGKSWMRRLLGLNAMALVALFAGCGGNTEAQKTAHLATGDKLVQENKVPEALIEYQSAVQLDNRDGQARLKLGRTFVKVGDAGRAMEHLVRAADLLPDDSDVQLEAARALLTAGRFEDARTRAEGVIRKEPKNALAHVLRASATAGLKDTDAAIATLEEAVKLDPKQSEALINLAALQASQGRQAEAEAGFKQAVAVNPKSIGSYLALANYYWVTRRPAESIQALLDGIGVDSSNIALNRSLANLYLVLQRAPEAETPLKRIVASSQDPQARLSLADYYIGQKRAPEARAALEPLMKVPAAAAAARARLAGIEYETGRPAEAHRLIDALIAEEPTNAQVHVVKGGWLLGEKKLEEAFAQAELAVKADPKSSDGFALLGSVQLARRKPEEAFKAYTEVLQLRPASVDAQVALANLNVDRGRHGEAADLARQAVAANPTNGMARVALARALLAQGNVDQAQNELRPVIDAAPDLVPVLTLAGQIQVRQGDTAGARQSFSRALAQDPRSPEALGGLVNLSLAAKRRDEAAALVNTQLGKAPDDPILQIIAGRTYAATGDLARSEAALRRAIDLDPSLMEAYHVLGQVFVRQNKLDEARTAYEARLKERPNDVGAHTMVGMLLLTQGKMADAKAQFEKVVSIDPRAAVALNNLAYFDAEAGSNLDVALTRAQTAKSLLPDDADVNDTLGWIYVKRNLGALAVPFLEQAVQKGPTNPVYHFHLGMAHLKAANAPAARQSLERALEISPTFPGSTEAKTALASIAR
jgi:tetratricopeptide (TPR) repeat protein